MKKFYITTPIYYPSAKLHIGHAYTTIAGDVLARYKKKKGFDVFYLTGTDEHGQKIETVANEKGIEPKKYVDEIVVDIKKTWDLLNIEFDRFIRTTDEDHKKNVQKIFTKLLENGDIYLDKYEGLYCKSDESYYTKTQVENNKCPDCGKDLELISEESYFFKCSKYIDRLVKFYKDYPDFLEPRSRLNELINNFIKPGLDDLAVSRTSFKWGIPVKENEEHVIYVWIDALSNYITALGYGTDNEELFEKYWPADVQLLGKEIVRFHAIYWPMLLMALDLPLPKKLFAHGWLLMENDKMSKSKGNVIYPDFLISNYGQDSLRYYLMREVPFGSDGQFTPTSFINRINNDLVNDLSNLLNRTIIMCNKYLKGEICYNDYTNKNYKDFDDIFNKLVESYEANIESLHYSKSLEDLWNIISNTNKMIDLEEPWVLGKDVEKNVEQLSKILWFLLNTLNKISHLLEPFMPETSIKIRKNIDVTNDKISKNEVLENINDLFLEKYIVSQKPEILYMRINTDDEVEKISSKMKEDLVKSKEDLQNVPRGTIPFSDFEKMDFKVGLIKKCVKHPKADKLYLLKVQVEGKEKQIISSLVEFYKEEELINKKVLLLNNLEPTKIRGELSEGMLITSESDKGTKIIEIDNDLNSIIK